MEIPVEVAFPQRPTETAERHPFREVGQMFEEPLLPDGETHLRGRLPLASAKPSFALHGDPPGEDFTEDLSQRVEVITRDPFVKGQIFPVKEGFRIRKREDFSDFLVTDRLG
jgi:hypothetical protein